MDFITENLLTILILLPVFGALATLGHSMFWKQESALKWITLGFTLVNFLISLFLLGAKTLSVNGFYFEKNIPWIKAINTNYHVGVDGMSLWLVILTTFIMPIAVISTWHAVEKSKTAFYVFFLLLESAMLGVFMSLDLLVFYLFFEASLVPMFFLIGIWGGENRIYAAVKFFVYTALGSLLMLVAIIALYYLHLHSNGVGTFDYVMLVNSLQTGKLILDHRHRFAFVRRICIGIFDQSSAFPVSHLAARRTYRSTDGGFGYSRRRDVENGNLRIDAV